jgi:hypothetical protein
MKRPCGLVVVDLDPTFTTAPTMGKLSVSNINPWILAFTITSRVEEGLSTGAPVSSENSFWQEKTNMIPMK